MREKQQDVPRIGITMGDPAGIGPEVTLKAVVDMVNLNYIPIVIGRVDLVEHYFSSFMNRLQVISPSEIDKIDFAAGNIYFCDVTSSFPIPQMGEGSAQTGKDSLSYIDMALNLRDKELIDAIVTAPVSKALINKSGLHFTGHTEYIADFVNVKTPYMMMYSPDYSVLLVTTHLAISSVEKNIDEESIYNTIVTGYQAMGKIKGREPRLAITGLDPHCGDNGAISDFDDNITEKAIEKARDGGYSIAGPFAADTIFIPEKWRNYDLVITMYHDQGLIPFKMMAFDEGVNVTLGLPIIRTSVDHGTAFDIAGKNIASHSSMVKAIELGLKLLAL